MKFVSCNQFVLLLCNIPLNGQCLFLSIIHQLQQQTSSYPFPPSEHLHRLRFAVYHEFRNNINHYSKQLISQALHQGFHHEPTQDRYLLSFLIDSILDSQTIGGIEVIRALHRRFGWGFEVYRDQEGLFTLVPSTPDHPVLKLYHAPPFFDSIVEIVRSSETASINSTSQPQHLIAPSFKIGTYNLRGVADTTLQLMLDDLFTKLNFDIICVQETHLRTHRFETKGFAWVLGRQTFNRASRGVGFLIRKSLLPLCFSFQFPTINIGEMSIKDPRQLCQSLVIVCVHKLSDGDSASSRETGNYFN